ncbi:MAG: amino acid adenylation domain-containing protein [Candidatus Omnitrophica bacterium]|nr:amino acid adenylation domain-containing protein [Candidatus Omnitrophota bacterium]
MEYRLPTLLRQSAKSQPFKVAIRQGEEELSYEDLNLLSDKLASCLVDKGLKVGDRVGIYIDKSIDAVIAIFGILKSGGCYVSLDPLDNSRRQTLIVKDCSLKYLISSSKKLPSLVKIIRGIDSLEYIFVVDANKKESSRDWCDIKMVFKKEIFNSDVSISPRSRRLKDNNSAYILYTSGSTGKPRGVEISHRASLAFINWANKYFNITKADIVAAQSPFHFDLSIFDIFVSIKAGATICIVPQSLSIFPKSLADFIESQKISTWYSTPSVLIKLLYYGNLQKRNLSALKRIIFAGEVFPPKHLHKLMKILPGAKYYNLYGPTETNVCTCYFLKRIPKVDKPIPIGCPCRGQYIFIVDKAGNLVKNGQSGELCVSGPTLMQGYWNNSQATEKAMIKLNFLNKASKVYRTGDLAKIRKNGDILYCGRNDEMLKVRGYRVEPAEIEAVLHSCPGIKEAAVVGVSADAAGDRIKAVISLKTNYSVSESKVKLFCSRQLPSYMVPAEIFFKKSLPRLSTGKIDRKKLKTIRR